MPGSFLSEMLPTKGHFFQNLTKVLITLIAIANSIKMQ